MLIWMLLKLVNFRTSKNIIETLIMKEVKKATEVGMKMKEKKVDTEDRKSDANSNDNIYSIPTILTIY